MKVAKGSIGNISKSQGDKKFDFLEMRDNVHEEYLLLKCNKNKFQIDYIFVHTSNLTAYYNLEFSTLIQLFCAYFLSCIGLVVI